MIGDFDFAHKIGEIYQSNQGLTPAVPIKLANKFCYLDILQEKGHLHLGNKLTKQHKDFRQNVMKVRLAVQVFSQSVADALDTLRSMDEYPEFKDSAGTARFLRVS